MSLKSNQVKKNIVKSKQIILALICVFGLGMLSSCGGSGTSTQSESYEKPINSDSNTSSDISSMSDFQLGKHYFEKGEFAKAEESLRNSMLINLDGKASSDMYFWLGHALFSQDKFRDAKNAFALSKNKDAEKMMKLAEKGMEKPK